MQTILLIGLGKIGLPVAQTLLSQGNNVIGVSRQVSAIPNTLLNLPNFHHIQANASQLTAHQLQPFSSAISHICIIVSPDQLTPHAYQQSYLAICETIVALGRHLPNLQRVVFISSTSVYGQNAGEVIDINTPIQPPTSANAQILLQAEKTLQQHFGEKCTIIRPSGIYGQARLRLIKLVQDLAVGRNTPPQNTWTNRIFDTDLVHVIVNTVNATVPLPIYLATDSMPVPLYDVLTWLAATMTISIELSPNFPTTGKRLIHNLPSDWLAYKDFKQGYYAVLENFSAQ